jgi:ubiquinone/menaquinone biosynthesis C-methylase UbiE
MYMKPWVQKLIQQIQQFLQAQAKAGWLDIDPSKPQRVLDYACGNGTVIRVGPKDQAQPMQISS